MGLPRPAARRPLVPVRPRWQEALDAGYAPKVVLGATHEAALAFCDLEDLKAHAVDAVTTEACDGELRLADLAVTAEHRGPLTR